MTLMNLTKQLKLQELLTQLNSLENKEVLPNEVDKAIKEEVSSLAEKLKQNPTIKILQSLQNEIAKFKQEFNLKPLVSLIEETKAELLENQTALINEFKTKLEAFKQSIPAMSEQVTFDFSNLESEIANLKKQLSKNVIPSFAKQIKETEAKLAEMIRTSKVLDDLSDEKEKEATQSQFAAFEQRIKDLKIQFQKRGGGSMPFKVSINGTILSTRYADINFKGQGVTYTTSDNNTTKQVDLTLTASATSFVDNEVVSGSGTAFTLANTPVLGSEKLFGNGQRLTPVVDYTISGSAITTNNSWLAGQILADYRK